MKNLLNIAVVTILLSLSLTACKKDKKDTTAPEITIESPANHASHKSGDMLHIHVDVKDNDEIHEIEAFLITKHMNVTDTVWMKHAHPDAATYTLEGHYTIGTVMHTDFSLSVTATDHAGNKAEKSTSFHVMQ